MEALGQSVALADANDAGYLGLHDFAAVQHGRADFGALCEGIAAEYLQSHHEILLAKQALRADIFAIGSKTETGRFSVDEADLFERLAVNIDVAIDLLGSKSGWQRTLILWFFRTPGIIKALLLALIATLVAVSVTRIFGQ